MRGSSVVAMWLKDDILGSRRPPPWSVSAPARCNNRSSSAGLWYRISDIKENGAAEKKDTSDGQLSEDITALTLMGCIAWVPTQPNEEKQSRCLPINQSVLAPSYGARNRSRSKSPAMPSILCHAARNPSCPSPSMVDPLHRSAAKRLATPLLLLPAARNTTSSASYRGENSLAQCARRTRIASASSPSRHRRSNSAHARPQSSRCCGSVSSKPVRVSMRTPGGRGGDRKSNDTPPPFFLCLLCVVC